jgi:hypothetical protein
MRSSPLLTAVALALACSLAGAACSSKSEPRAQRVEAAEARLLLLDRNWMDRMPQSSRDHLFVFRFVPSMGGGVFQDRTLFKGLFELFVFEATGEELRFFLPETNERVRAAYTIETVDGPEPFDLRLTIPESPRGPKVYYGIRAETDRDGSLLERKLAALRSAE